MKRMGAQAGHADLIHGDFVVRFPHAVAGVVDERGNGSHVSLNRSERGHELRRVRYVCGEGLRPMYTHPHC